MVEASSESLSDAMEVDATLRRAPPLLTKCGRALREARDGDPFSDVCDAPSTDVCDAAPSTDVCDAAPSEAVCVSVLGVASVCVSVLGVASSEPGPG